MKIIMLLLGGLTLFQNICLPQTDRPKNTAQKIGGGCEGCEAILQSPVAFDKLNWVDTLPDFKETGPKLELSGKVLMADGKTPAANIVVYIYHTDQTGHYTNKYNEKGWAGRHGYIKGWIKTNKKGEYKFYTLKPAPYPGTNIPAHIHPIIKEPDKNEYYIDEYLFEGDPFLTASQRAKVELRGGSGIISLQMKSNIYYGKRNIILGLNIPSYPKGN
jgi:protocatechuate 3,4-dioxygenase beta subunit